MQRKALLKNDERCGLIGAFLFVLPERAIFGVGAPLHRHADTQKEETMIREAGGDRTRILFLLTCFVDFSLEATFHTGDVILQACMLYRN